MQEQYVIKPNNRSLKAFKGIEEVSFSFPVTPVLEEGLISEILVNTKEASWKITLFLKNELHPEQVRELEQALGGLVLGLSKVHLEMVYPKDLPPLEERIDRNWDRIIAAAGGNFPGINGWLTEAKYRLINDQCWRFRSVTRPEWII